MTGDPALLEVRGISRAFGSTRALQDVHVAVRAGSVHALVGENGAGKSTLGKIIAGVLPPDQGELLLRGVPVSFRSPRQALEHGIAYVAQELALVPRLTVAQNVFLGAEPRRASVIDRRALAARFEALLRGCRVRPARRRPGRQPRHRPAPAGGDPASARPRRGPHRARRADRGAGRPRRRSGCTRSSVASPPGVAPSCWCRTSWARCWRWRTPSRCFATVGSSGRRRAAGRDRGQPHRGDARPRRRARRIPHAGLARPTRRSCSRPTMSGRPASWASPCASARARSWAWRASWAPVAPSWAGPSRVPRGRRPGGCSCRGSPTGGTPRAGIDAGVALIPESRKDEGLCLGRPVRENVSLASLPRLSRLGFVRRRARGERVSATPSSRGQPAPSALEAPATACRAATSRS